MQSKPLKLTCLTSAFIIAATLFLLRTSPVIADEASQKPEQQAALYKAAEGAWSVKITDENWHDDKRNRDVPVQIYLPEEKADAGKHPVIVFSHGWGASRTTYAYFCKHLASHGYLVISPTHAGSDMASIPFGAQPAGGAGPKREGLKESIEDPDNLKNRPTDISFVIDQIGNEPALAKIADLSRIGVAGHSFGAYTAMAIGGMTVDLPEGKAKSLADSRVKAVLPMSPEGPGTMGITPTSWDRFAVPILFMTGTKDYGQGKVAASWRDAGFEKVRTVDHYLLTIEGATHFTFAIPDGGGFFGRQPGAGPAHHDADLIDSVGTAFFDAYLSKDPKARAWLAAYFAAKHEDGTAQFVQGVGR